MINCVCVCVCVCVCDCKDEGITCGYYASLYITEEAFTG